MKKSSDDAIVIPRKALAGIAPAIAIVGVLLATGKAPEALLFLIGAFLGIIIGKGMFEKK